MAIAGFFVVMVVQMIDPVLMLGPVAAGFAVKAWWKALLVGGGWVLFVKFVMKALMSSQPPIPNAGLIALSGICAGVVVAGVIWLIRDQIRKAKARQ